MASMTTTREELAMSTTQLTDTFDIQRGTNWARAVIVESDDYEVKMPNWDGPKHYVNEKQRQALRDMEHLARYLQAFVETGEVRHFDDYRMMLDVMVAEADNGAWWAIAEGAR